MDTNIFLIAAVVAYLFTSFAAPFVMLASVILSLPDGGTKDGTGEWLILFSVFFAVVFIGALAHLLTLTNL